MRSAPWLAGLALAFGAAAASAEPIGAAADLSFTLKASAGAAKVGEPAAVQVVVTAADGFKANAEYPNKIKDLAVNGAAALAAAEVEGAATEKAIVYSIAVTPRAAGTHAITGEVRFSVCNDKSCFIKKVPLATSVTGT